MPDISIQFFATPDELLSFTKEMCGEFGIYLIAMRFPHFEAKLVMDGELDQLFATSSDYRRLAFTLEPPNLAVKNTLDFGDKNPDYLRLELGKSDDMSLEESWLSCRTENKAAFTVWKKIAKALKDRTFAGITATNRENGKQAEYPKQRYSSGAKALEDRGVTMLPAVGPKGPIIKLGLLTSPPTE